LPGHARTGRCSRWGAHSASASSPCFHGPRRRSPGCCCQRISTVQIRTAGAPSAAAGCTRPPARRSGSSRQPSQHSTAPATWLTRRTRTTTSPRSPAPAAATPASRDPRRRSPWRPACLLPHRRAAPAPPCGGVSGRPPTSPDLSAPPQQCRYLHPSTPTTPPPPPPPLAKQAGIEPRTQEQLALVNYCSHHPPPPPSKNPEQ